MGSGAGLFVRVLSSLEVTRDGVRLGPSPEAVKPRVLIGVLALNANRVVSKSALVDSLWEEPPDTARNVVEKCVSTWRKVLEPGRLDTVGQGYRLNLGVDECDALSVRDALARARAAVASGDAAGAEATLRSAVQQCGGFAAHAEAPPLPPEERQEVEDLRIALLEEWARAVLTGNGPDADEVVDALHRALRRHPLRESLAEALVMLLCRQGRQHDAITVYERIRRTLGEEIGQDPCEALQVLHLRVLRHDPELFGSPTSTHVDNLSPRNPQFTGRDRELAEIGHRFEARRSAPVPAIALWGLVGGGKSALALEWAHRERDAYACTWWVDAATPESTLAGLEALGVRLGVTLPADRQPALHRLWDALDRLGRWLVVFDDAESIAALSDYWPTARSGQVLITSLNPEWWRLADPMPVDVLSPEDAVALLRQEVGASTPATEAALTEALGHLPLALSQAGAFIHQTGMSAEDYWSLFRRRREDLLKRGAPDDHRGTIDALWRLARTAVEQDPAAVDLLGMCSLLASAPVPLELLTVAPGHLPGALAAAVTGEVGLEDAIRMARRYSLLSRFHGSLHMHCLVQTVVRSSMDGPRRSDLRLRLARMLVAYAPDLVEPRSTWERWESVVPHVGALAEDAVAEGPADDELLDLVRRAGRYLSLRASFDQAVVLMRHALALVSAAAADDVSVARVQVELGELLEQSGQLKEALDTFEQAVGILQKEAPADDPWLARALGGLGNVLTCHLGVSLWAPEDLHEAEGRFVYALSVMEAAWGPDSPVVGRTLSGLGQVLQDQGHLERGRECKARAVEILEAGLGPDHPDVGHAYDKLGYVLGLLHEYDEGRRCLERAYAILADAHGADAVMVGWPLSNLGFLLHSAGAAEESLEYQARAHAIFAADDPDSPATQISAWRLARVYADLGRRGAAVRTLEPAVERLRTRLGDTNADVRAMAEDLRALTLHG